MLANSANALVTFDSVATSRFTLLDAGGMVIVYDTMPEPAITTTTGTGLASIDADMHTTVPPGAPSTFPFMPSVDDSVIIDSAVSGSADAPFGTSLATVMNGFMVNLMNPGTLDAVAVFEFEYTWSTVFTKDDATLESAFNSPFFHLTGFAPSGDETLMIDVDGLGVGAAPMSVAEWLVHPADGSDFGDSSLAGGSAATATVHAFVTVPGMSEEMFSVITDSAGGAFHRNPAIPEPITATLGLMGLGVLGAATRRRVV